MAHRFFSLLLFFNNPISGYDYTRFIKKVRRLRLVNETRIYNTGPMERVFQKIYFRNIQIRNRLYSHRHYYFRFHRSRDCHTMQKNVVSPMIPAYAVGLATRDVILLEFSSSILCLILAGKVGSNIASEIGTMRVTEQIDALEIMGVNSANLLILPKIAAMVSFIPVLVVFSMASGITGGFLIAQFTDIISVSKYIYGLQSFFNEYYIWQAIFKALFFAFVISSVASYYGYKVKGGALEVGQASTDSVVVSSVIVLLLDVVLTQILF